MTSCDTPYLPNQSKLVRTSIETSRNKIQSFCGKYDADYR